MGLLDAAIGIGLGAYGDKPQVPNYNPVDTTAEQGKAIAGNISQLGNLGVLAKGVDLANQDALTAMLRRAIPGFDSIVSKTGSNINDELSGKLPSGVADQLQTSDAAKALSGGFGGSGMGGALTARDLGLTSLDLTQKGISSAQSWLKTSKAALTPGSFDVSGMFVSPAMRIGIAAENNSNQFQTSWLSNQIAAMPDPNMKALAQGASQDLGTISSAVGSYAGGGGGGGGGSM